MQKKKNKWWLSDPFSYFQIMQNCSKICHDYANGPKVHVFEKFNHAHFAKYLKKIALKCTNNFENLCKIMHDA